MKTPMKCFGCIQCEIEGEFDIEFNDGMTHLKEGDCIIIPKGVRHRPVCRELVKCLLIELEGTLNQGNIGGTYNIIG